MGRNPNRKKRREQELAERVPPEKEKPQETVRPVAESQPKKVQQPIYQSRAIPSWFCNLIQRWRALSRWWKGSWISVAIGIVWAIYTGVSGFLSKREQKEAFRRIETKTTEQIDLSKQILNLKEITLSEDLMRRYPGGLMILGMDKGVLRTEPRTGGFIMDLDPQSRIFQVTSNTWKVLLGVEKLFDPVTKIGFERLGFELFYVDNQSPTNLIAPAFPLFIEIVDRKRGIFILGMK